MQIPAKDVEFATILKPLYEFALYVDQSTKEYYLIRINDGEEVDRHLLSDLNFEAKIEVDPATFESIMVLSLNNVEFFSYGFDWAFDGCLLTHNGNRTAEQGIQDFENAGFTIIRTETKIIIVLS